MYEVRMAEGWGGDTVGATPQAPQADNHTAQEGQNGDAGVRFSAPRLQGEALRCAPEAHQEAKEMRAVHYRPMPCEACIKDSIRTDNPEAVTCKNCLRTAKRLRGFRRISTEKDPELDKRYYERRAKEKRGRRDAAESNWRVLDGLCEEEMQKIRDYMNPNVKKVFVH